MTSSGKQTLASEPPEPLDVVETPTSPSSGLALSRFEFETGKSNDGTKILMVEWDASAQKEEHLVKGGRRRSSDWEVSWEGKGDVLPIRDVNPDARKNTRRLYFLLPPGAPVPALVSITPKPKDSGADGAGGHGGGGDGAEAGSGGVVLCTKPMPAIFPAELAGKHDAGRRGVLHTIWAKKRLAELQAEISAEMKANGESVGLEMAMQERQWIVDHFGLAPDPGMPQPTKLHIPQSSVSPASPRSPVGGRLGEKLRGLKLATSPAELAAASQGTKSIQPPRTQPLITSLSPPVSGVAASSASAGNHRSLQPGSSGGVASLDAIVGGGLVLAAAVKAGGGEDANEEDLFALPMSPRSPEMKRSPFSIL